MQTWALALLLVLLCLCTVPLRAKIVHSRWRYERPHDPVNGTLKVNMYYIKVPKCASSTAAGVARNIGHTHLLNGARKRVAFKRHAYKKHIKKTEDSCGNESAVEDVRYYVYANHAPYDSVARHVKWCRQSFLWTVVREPSSVIMSAYYYFGLERGLLNKDGSNDVKAQLKGIGAGNSDFGATISNYISLHSWPRPPGKAGADVPLDVHIAETMAEFDFIGVAERFDESMVVLAYLLNIPLEEVLHVNSKITSSDAASVEPAVDTIAAALETTTSPRSNTDSRVRRAHTSFRPGHRTTLAHKKLEDEPAEVQAAFANKTQWPDTILWQRANEQLDKFMSINGMGERLKAFQKLQLAVNEVCNVAHFPDIVNKGKNGKFLNVRKRQIVSGAHDWKDGDRRVAFSASFSVCRIGRAGS